MYRQFVNLIVHDQRTTLYSLRRLGIIPHLFHESPAAGAQQDATPNNKINDNLKLESSAQVGVGHQLRAATRDI